MYVLTRVRTKQVALHYAHSTQLCTNLKGLHTNERGLQLFDIQLVFILDS